MHIKPGEQPQLWSGRQNESSSGRKLRLGGGASRVPVNCKTDSPLQVLVSAIGQSFGTKPQVRTHTVGSKDQSATKTSLFGSKSNHGASSTTTPSESKTTSSLLARTRTKEPATPAAGTRSSVANSLRTPSTPAVSRVSSTPSASRVPSTPSFSRVPSTPSASRIPSTPSASRIPSTPSVSRIPSTPSVSRIPSTPSASRIPLTPTTPKAARTPTLTKVSSTPASSSRTYYSSAKVPATPTSKVSSTPSAKSRLQGTAAEKSSRRISLSSSSSSSISSTGVSTSGRATTRRTQASSGQHANTSVRNSSSARAANPTTPVSKNISVFAPKTPKAQSDPITPASKFSSIFTPRRPGVSPNSILKRQGGDTGALPITPVSRQIAVTPGTPIHGVQNDVSTPCSDGNKTVAFYTPSSTLPLTPLQPKNFNAFESSRRLHFGADGVAAGDQENLGCLTPKPYDAAANTTEPTFTFDKNRLAQIRARRSSSQLLKSPAQRVIRVLETHRPAYTPARGLQQVDEDRSARFDDDDGAGCGFFQACPSTTPGRRKLANSLF